MNSHATKKIGVGLGDVTAPITMESLVGRYGLSAEQAGAIGWRLADAVEVQVNFGPRRTGLVIPFYGADGKPSVDPKTGRPYTRVRLHGWQGKGKYRAPAGSGIHAYLLPTLDWKSAAQDAGIPLLITEGEGKAAKASLTAGFPSCVGLTGVDCLCNRDGHIAYELAGWRWAGREVFLLFDAPLHEQLKSSRERAALRLAVLGAKVLLLDIDRTPSYRKFRDGDSEDKKMGLDDYIRAGGTWGELVATAEQYNAVDIDNPLLTSLALVIGDKACYVHISGKHLGLIHLKNDIVDVVAPVTVQRMITAQGGTTTKTVPAFQEWLRSRRRTELKGIVTRPDLPPLAITPDGYWNSFKGMVTIPQRNRRLARKFYRFLRLFFAGRIGRLSNEARLHRRKYLQWLAHLFQRLDVRHETSWTFAAAEGGVGKSTLAELPAFIIGLGNGAGVLGEAALTSQWSSFLDGMFYIVFNEPSTKQLSVANKLKGWRTDPELNVNHKGGAEYRVPNRLCFCFTTNSDHAFAISADERRDWIWTPEWRRDDPCGGQRWEDVCAEVAELAKKSPTFRSAVLWELMFNVNLSDYDPYAPAGDSRAKQVAAQSSKSEAAIEEEDVWDLILQDIEEYGVFAKPAVEMVGWLRDNGIRLPKSRVQHIARVRAEKLVWTAGTALERRPGGKETTTKTRVWFVGRRKWADLDRDERLAALGWSDNAPKY
jgi:hypothetical protein